MSAQKSPNKFPRTYSITVAQEHIRSMKVPRHEDLTNIHAFVRICDLAKSFILERTLPDEVNPRCHDKIQMKAHVPQAIAQSLEDNTEDFHLMNRGCLILAKKAWYDNKEKVLSFVISSPDEDGLVDGATTDRVLERIRQELISDSEFIRLEQKSMPAQFRDSYLHLEIIAGEIESDLRVNLADARNTSRAVQEFSLENLRGNFDWLKDILENSEFRGKIRYQENEPKSVDIRKVLGLLTLFHPNWKDDEEPIMAYTAKGRVIDKYEKADWIKGYKKLGPVVLDILRLYDFVHVNFQPLYKKAFGPNSKLGRRKEVKYIDPDKNEKPKKLPLTNMTTRYVLTDGWLYPLLASFRVLLEWPKGSKYDVSWKIDPQQYFKNYGYVLVRDVAEQSKDLAGNPNATGKSRMLWSGLKIKVENHMLKTMQRS